MSAGSTYPAHLETDVVLRDGRTVRVRPARPDDRDRLEADPTVASIGLPSTARPPGSAAPLTWSAASCVRLSGDLATGYDRARRHLAE
jgi:hypothetical protein